MGAEWLTPERAWELLQEDWTYLDVRTVAEFSEGHVPRAKNIWFGKWNGPELMENPRFLEIVQANFPMDRKLIVGCQTGMERSIRAAEQLRCAGFSNVLRMRGGFEAERDEAGRVVLAGWSLRGLPTTSESATADQYEFLVARADAKAGMPTEKRHK